MNGQKTLDDNQCERILALMNMLNTLLIPSDFDILKDAKVRSITKVDRDAQHLYFDLQVRVRI